MRSHGSKGDFVYMLFNNTMHEKFLLFDTVVLIRLPYAIKIYLDN